MAIILPGEMLFPKPVRVKFGYISGGKTYASVVTFLTENGRAVPLEGAYFPKKGDEVVGVITEVRYSYYGVDLNCPWRALLLIKSESDRRFALGDVIRARIEEVDEVRTVLLGKAQRLPRGIVLSFETTKIPRLIGKNASMLALLKERTGADIVVGSNGFVWVSSEKVSDLMKAFRMIQETPHIPGLTERVSRLLRGEVDETERKETGRSPEDSGTSQRP